MGERGRMRVVWSFWPIFGQFSCFRWFFRSRLTFRTDLEFEVGVGVEVLYFRRRVQGRRSGRMCCQYRHQHAAEGGFHLVCSHLMVYKLTGLVSRQLTPRYRPSSPKCTNSAKTSELRAKSFKSPYRLIQDIQFTLSNSAYFKIEVEPNLVQLQVHTPETQQLFLTIRVLWSSS